MKRFSATIMKEYNDKDKTQDTRYMIELDKLNSIKSYPASWSQSDSCKFRFTKHKNAIHFY